MTKRNVIALVVILLMILGISQNVLAQEPQPETIFNVICWEKIHLDINNRDYVRYHLGYWSSGNEPFSTLIISQSGFATFGSLQHDTYSEWKTIAGNVDDIVVTLYSEDGPVNTTVIFSNEYDSHELVLSIGNMQECTESQFSSIQTTVPTVVPTSLPITIPSIPVNYPLPSSQNNVGLKSHYDPGSGKTYYYVPVPSGVVPLPPPYYSYPRN